jgi:hypothetical protein
VRALGSPRRDAERGAVERLRRRPRRVGGLVDSAKGGFKHEAPAVRSPVDGVLLFQLPPVLVKYFNEILCSYIYLKFQSLII